MGWGGSQFRKSRFWVGGAILGAVLNSPPTTLAQVSSAPAKTSSNKKTRVKKVQVKPKAGTKTLSVTRPNTSSTGGVQSPANNIELKKSDSGTSPAQAAGAPNKPQPNRYVGKLSKAPRFSPGARQLAEQKNFLGLRVYVRKNYSRIAHPADWILLRDSLIANSNEIGYDLIYAWDKRLPGAYVDSGPMDVNGSRAMADQWMLEGRFQEAFDLYQKIAVELRRLKRAARTQSQKKNIDFLLPYIFHSMGRALYGAGRFDESFVTLRWIPQTYAKFRQVQYEKMWAAFRGGRIDQALGSIASQRSEYFSRYINPESYLVQTYLYKKLCRDSDYQQVLSQMRSYLSALKAGQYTIDTWANSDVETLILWRLVNQKPVENEFVTLEEMTKEQDRIRNQLEKAFESQKARLIDDLEKSLAYVQLTVRSGSGNVLKPVEKLPSRAALFDLDLEIWPADSQEEWIDELGTHRFIGDSLCLDDKKPQS